MSVVIVIIEPEVLSGMYLETFDHEADNGKGYGTFTHDITKAMSFNDTKDALDFWKKQSTVRPYRNDGEPNRPLTASTITLETIK